MSETVVRAGLVGKSRKSVIAGLQLLSHLILRNRVFRGLIERSRSPVTFGLQFMNDLIPKSCDSCGLLERSTHRGFLRFLNDRIFGIIMAISLGDARSRLDDMKKTIIRCIYERMGFQDIGLPNAAMGLCCCKTPDDDETLAEQKPIKDADPAGGYGTITEKQLSDESAEKSSEKVPLEGDESSAIGVIPDEATEATPLMESPDVVPKQPGEDQSAPTDITEEVFKDDTAEPTPDQPEVAPQIEITPDTTPADDTPEFASATSSTPRASVDDPSTISPSDEALQEADGGEESPKRKKSVAKKIKKKLGKLGGSTKTRSRKSTSSTGSESQAGSQTGSLGKQRSVSDTTEQ